MSVSASGQGPREKSRTPKPKPSSDAPETPVTPLLLTQGPPASASSTPAQLEASTEAALDDSSKCTLDRMTAEKLVSFLSFLQSLDIIFYCGVYFELSITFFLWQLSFFRCR